MGMACSNTVCEKMDPVISQGSNCWVSEEKHYWLPGMATLPFIHAENKEEQVEIMEEVEDFRLSFMMA